MANHFGKRIHLLIGTALFTTSIPAAHATGPFTIANRTSAFNAADAVFGSVVTAMNTAADQIEATVNDGLMSEANRRTLFAAMAKGNASNMSEISADYGSNPSKMVLGVGVQAGSSTSNISGAFASSSANALPSIGGGAQADALIGFKGNWLGINKLGPLDGKDLTLYLNFMSYSVNLDSFKFGIFNLGTHAQYKLVQPRGSRYLAQWGGIDIGTGFSYASSSATTASKLSFSQDQGVATVATNLTYDLGIKTTTYTVPLEVSTNATLFYLFTVFVGGGLDLNFGTSTTTGTAAGPVTATVSDATLAAAAGSSNIFSGDATLNLEDTGVSEGPSHFSGRFFGGVQANLWTLKLVVGGHYLTTGAIAGSAALRFAI